MTKPKYVEALVERDGDHIYVSGISAYLDAGAWPTVQQILEGAFEKSRNAENALNAGNLAKAIVRALDDHLDYTGGDLVGNPGAPITGLGASVATLLRETGILPFEEVAILRLSDLKTLIANQRAEVLVINTEAERRSA